MTEFCRSTENHVNLDMVFHFSNFFWLPNASLLECVLKVSNLRCKDLLMSIPPEMELKKISYKCSILILWIVHY